MMFMDLTIRMIIVYSMPEEAKAQAVADTQAALTKGSRRHRIAENLPFDQMAKAHEIIEEGVCVDALLSRFSMPIETRDGLNVGGHVDDIRYVWANWLRGAVRSTRSATG